MFLDPSSQANLIGGKNDKSQNANPPDGDNARIVLNALSTTYDYAGLLSSVAKILSINGVTNPSIGGTDASATSSSTPSPAPKPVSIQLNVAGQGNYEQVKAVVHDFERSIRPFKVTQMQLNGTNAVMNFSMQVTTYYQVAKTLDTTKKEIN